MYVTLFEAEDLWQEAQRLQHCGLPGPVPTSSCAGSLNSDQVDQTALPKPKPQGVILVTEHNAEVNAGFAVLQGSNHAPPLALEPPQTYAHVARVLYVGSCDQYALHIITLPVPLDSNMLQRHTFTMRRIRDDEST